MNTEKRDINSIKPNPQNVRRHPQAQIAELQKSVSEFGAVRPIVIDEDGVILAGHGLYEACKANGDKEVDVLVKAGLSDSDKKKLLLADNKIYSMGMDDYSVIEDILSDLGAKGDFEVPGYDSNVLEEMYGIKSVEQEAEEMLRPLDAIEAELEEAKDGDEQAFDGGDDDSDGDREPTPSSHVQEARKEAEEKAKQFVICPNCGEKVYL